MVGRRGQCELKPTSLYRGDWAVGFKREGLGRAESQGGKTLQKAGRRGWSMGSPSGFAQLALI